MTVTATLAQFLTDLTEVFSTILGQFADLITFMVTNPFILVAMGVIFFGAIVNRLRSLIG